MPLSGAAVERAHPQARAPRLSAAECTSVKDTCFFSVAPSLRICLLLKIVYVCCVHFLPQLLPEKAPRDQEAWRSKFNVVPAVRK